MGAVVRRADQSVGDYGSRPAYVGYLSTIKSMCEYIMSNITHGQLSGALWRVESYRL